MLYNLLHSCTCTHHSPPLSRGRSGSDTEAASLQLQTHHATGPSQTQLHVHTQKEKKKVVEISNGYIGIRVKWVYTQWETCTLHTSVYLNTYIVCTCMYTHVHTCTCSCLYTAQATTLLSLVSKRVRYVYDSHVQGSCEIQPITNQCLDNKL